MRVVLIDDDALVVVSLKAILEANVGISRYLPCDRLQGKNGITFLLPAGLQNRV